MSQVVTVLLEEQLSQESYLSNPSTDELFCDSESIDYPTEDEVRHIHKNIINEAFEASVPYEDIDDFNDESFEESFDESHPHENINNIINEAFEAALPYEELTDDSL